MAGPIDFMVNFAKEGSWWQLVILATFASTLLYGIFYTIARSFNLRNLEITSKAEIMQAVATLFMILVVVGSIDMVEEFAIKQFLTSYSGVDDSIAEKPAVACGGEDPVEIEEVRDTLKIVQCRFAEQALPIANMQNQIKTYADQGFANAFVSKSVFVYLFGINVFSGSWLPELHKETENYRLMNNFTTSVLIKVNVVIIMVKYIANNMLTVFLPVGLFLRAFPPLRGVGALFIAIAISFYFIFPVLFVFTDPGFIQIPEPNIVGAPVPESQQSCYPTFQGVATQIQGQTVSTALNIAGIQQAARAIAKFNVFLTVHPFVAFAITVIIVRYMTFILGGDSYLIMRYLARVV